MIRERLCIAAAKLTSGDGASRTSALGGERTQEHLLCGNALEEIDIVRGEWGGCNVHAIHLRNLLHNVMEVSICSD